MSKYILKLARCIQELERIKGVRHGNNRFTNRDDKMSTLQNQWTKCPLILHKSIY